VVRASSELDPLAIRRKRGTSSPFVDHGPCGLDNALFKVSRVFLHDHDGVVDEVLFEHLALKLIG